MPSQMAVPTPKRPAKNSGSTGLTYSSKDGPTPVYGGKLGGKKKELSRLEDVVVQLYGRGLTRRKIAQLMLQHLAPANGTSPKARLRVALKRLRQMEERKWFRDALWERALVDADLKTPQILAGVTRKAIDGRVDAAKFALTVAGRYSEQADVQATQVNIVFGAEIPRPASRGIPSQTEAQDDVEEAEWDEVS